ncbi:MAG: phage tail protein [Candidatus Oceanisphaera merdipullorum]|nr:phage tail protein [Candidatus Oceanisphaera merdipullorum]
MTTFYTLLTTVGSAKLANATALGQPFVISQMAVGDGNGNTPTPNPSQTTLINELRRAPLNTLDIDPNNPSAILAEQVIPETVGGWWIRELGLYDADGDLVAVGNCPPTYKPLLTEGSGRTQVIRMLIVVSNTAAVTLKVDPAIVLATRGYVGSELKKHTSAESAHTPAQVGLGKVNNWESTHSYDDSEGGATKYATGKAVADAYNALRKSLIGSVVQFSMLTPPNGWLKANGAAISRTAYADLFAVIGTTYGVGDGTTTFNVPDARGLFPRNLDDGRGVDIGRKMGSEQGDTVQSHNHYLPTSAGLSWPDPNKRFAFNDNIFLASNVNYSSSDDIRNTTYPNREFDNNQHPAFATGTHDGVGSMGNFSHENRPKNIAFLACVKY